MLREFHLRMRRPGNQIILAIFLALSLILAFEALSSRIVVEFQNDFNIRDHARQLLQEGGVDALLAEADAQHDDFLRRAYLEIALDHTDSHERLVEILDLGSRIESDFDTAELLIHAAQDEAAAPRLPAEYFRTLDRIDSDYAVRRVLSEAADENRLDSAGWTDFIEAMRRIESDYDAAEALLEILEVWPDLEPLPEVFFQAVGEIEDEYHRERVAEKVEKKMQSRLSEGFLDAGSSG